ASTTTAIWLGAALVPPIPSGTTWSRRSPCRRGTIRSSEDRVCEAPAHHRARSIRHVRVRRGGGAWRLGRLGRVPVLRPEPGRIDRQGSVGVSQWLPRGAVVG